jgi:hypothetical protein
MAQRFKYHGRGQYSAIEPQRNPNNTPRALARIRRFVDLAQIYLEDGARHSALCNIIAAQRVLDGKPIPRGPKFWTLAPAPKVITVQPVDKAGVKRQMARGRKMLRRPAP